MEICSCRTRLGRTRNCRHDKDAGPESQTQLESEVSIRIADLNGVLFVFQDNYDLLDEFGNFLPDTSNAIAGHTLSEEVDMDEMATRRSVSQKLLHMIKDQDASSTMHTLLVSLQTALQDQAPIVGGLLLQLDLLVVPRRMSMYREEAIDTLISCLKDSNFPNGQLVVAETILSLQGRFSYSGKPLARAFLLKHAGVNKSFRAIMRSEQSSYALEES